MYLVKSKMIFKKLTKYSSVMDIADDDLTQEPFNVLSPLAFLYFRNPKAKLFSYCPWQLRMAM